VSLLTEPVENETLMNFYANVHPWGFWKPVRKMLAQEGRIIEPNTSAPRDFLNIAVGIAWQLTLVTMPLYAIFRDMRGLLISVLVFVTASIFLKRFWYNPLRLEEGEWEATHPAMLPSPQPGD
jgi:solute:Na+ symporter, SSS family